MSVRAVTSRSEDDQKTNLPSTPPKIGHLSEELSPRSKKIREAVAGNKRIEVAGYVCEHIRNKEFLRAQTLYSRLSKMHNTICYCAENIIFEKVTLLMFQAGLLNMPRSQIAGGYIPFGKAEERWITSGYATREIMEEVGQLQKKSQRFLDDMNDCICAKERFFDLRNDCIIYLENEIRQATPGQRYETNLSQYASRSFDHTKGIKEGYPRLQKEAVSLLAKTKKLRESLAEKEKPILEEELKEIIASLQTFVSWKPDFSQSVFDLRIDLIAHFWRGKNIQHVRNYLSMIRPCDDSSLLKVAKSFIKNKEFDLALEVYNYILTDEKYFSYGCYSTAMLTLEFYLAGSLQTSYLDVKQKLIFPKWEKTYSITKEEAATMNQLQEKCRGFVSAYEELKRAREWCFLVESDPTTHDPSRKEKANQILKGLAAFDEMFSLEFFKTTVEQCRESLLKIIATDSSETKPL